MRCAAGRQSTVSDRIASETIQHLVIISRRVVSTWRVVFRKELRSVSSYLLFVTVGVEETRSQIRLNMEYLNKSVVYNSGCAAEKPDTKCQLFRYCAEQTNRSLSKPAHGT